MLHQTYPSETRHGAGNHHVVKDVVRVDNQALLQAHAAADPSFRPLVVSALKNYETDLSLIDKLRNFIETRAVYAELISKGYVFERAQHEAAFEMQCAEETKLAAIRPLADQARRRLEAAVKGPSDIIAGRVISEIEADLVKIGTADEVFAKYGVAQTPLSVALINAIARIRSDIEKPLDLSNHYDQRINLSQIFFPPSVPLMLEEPSPAPPADPLPAPPSTTLRTAADVAAARG